MPYLDVLAKLSWPFAYCNKTFLLVRSWSRHRSPERKSESSISLYKHFINHKNTVVLSYVENMKQDGVMEACDRMRRRW